jgi:hypothetical protein
MPCTGTFPSLISHPLSHLAEFASFLAVHMTWLEPQGREKKKRQLLAVGTSYSAALTQAHRLKRRQLCGFSAKTQDMLIEHEIVKQSPTFLEPCESQ